MMCVQGQFILRWGKSFMMALAWGFALLLIGSASEVAFAKPFDCIHSNCGIAIDAPYPNLIVGIIDGIASPLETKAIFVFARDHGLWLSFPPNASKFAASVDAISLNISGDRSITVLVSASEAKAEYYKIGQLGRFSPHRGLYEKTAANAAYFDGFGCVMAICSLPNDKGCDARFHLGLYRFSDGVELDPTGKYPLKGGIVIDRYSMFPLSKNANPKP